VIPGAGDVLILDGAPDGRDVLLYLHGRCGDPEAFRAFARGVPPSITLISVKGDVRCKTSPRSQWSVSASAIDERLRRVVAAASARRVAAGVAPLRETGWLVFGYSQGALRAEVLLARFPDRYAAGVLAAGPRAPKSASFTRTPGSVVVLAGGHDARGHLQAAAEEMADEGRRVRYVVLPEARHGEYGPDAERLVGEALRWILAAPPFTGAAPTFQE
jgi:predicted esterase